MESQLLLVLGVVGVAAALVTLVMAFALGAGQLTGVARSLAILEQQVDAREVGRQDLPVLERLVKPFMASTQSLAHRLSPSGTSARFGRLLDLAGNPAWLTVERVMGAKGAGLIAGALLGLAYGGLNIKGLGIAAAGAVVLFFGPDLFLYNLGVKRQEQLRRGLADALDMLTVCVEAGQSFDGALLQVARSTTGPVAGEFARVLSEIQIGKSRGEAFSSLANRTSVEEAKNFVTALVQADRLGLPIAGVLREQSTQMRLMRRQHAEEQAQKVPVKIVFPMILCIFPALFVVIIGPGAIRIMEAFSGF